jgi:hypothetical protein
MKPATSKIVIALQGDNLSIDSPPSIAVRDAPAAEMVGHAGCRLA